MSFNNNRKISYAMIALFLGFFAIIICFFIEHYASTVLDSNITFNYESGFYAREEYSGQDYFSYDFLSDGVVPKSFLIHNSGDDFDVKLMDYVVYTALSKGKMSFEISPTIPCNLFIDGEYWGPL